MPRKMELIGTHSRAIQRASLYRRPPTSLLTNQTGDRKMLRPECQIGERRSGIICGVVKWPDHHCGCDLYRPIIDYIQVTTVYTLNTNEAIEVTQNSK